VLKIIISNSPALLTFIVALQIALSKPQRQHVLNVVDSLIVGQAKGKCAAALTYWICYYQARPLMAWILWPPKEMCSPWAGQTGNR
jgi:hypothetical protein